MWRDAIRAIEAVRAALGLFEAGPPLARVAPGGVVAVDVPVLYDGFAVDRMHFDPVRLEPLPKGCPEPPGGVGGAAVDLEAVRRTAERVLGEARVLGGAELEKPRMVWRVPVAWRSLIILHVRVDMGGRIVPDEPLTMELRRRLP